MFILIVYYVTEIGIHTQQGRVHIICAHVTHICLIVGFLGTIIYGFVTWHIWCLLSMLLSSVVIVYTSRVVKQQTYLPVIPLLVNFVFSLLYCKANVIANTQRSSKLCLCLIERTD